jgi:hypothetical protein
LNRCFCAAALLSVVLLSWSRPASADTIVSPFVGTAFAAETTFQTAESGVDHKKWIVGGSAGWLGAGLFGFEGEFSYVPRFFEAGRLLTGRGSNVTTLTGNALLAVPLSVTRESLRPYLSVGVGMLHASANDIFDAFPVDRNLLAVSIGGGAIGFFTSRTGIRFDLRHIRSVSSAEDPTTNTTEPRLGFWRATVGVALRY